MFGIPIGWALLRKLWPFIAIAALLAVIAFQWQLVKNANLENAAAKVALSQAVAVNERNADVIRRFDAERDEARKVAEAAIAAEKVRTAELNAIKKELRNAPGASDPASPYFDALFDRLRLPNAKVGH